MEKIYKLFCVWMVLAMVLGGLLTPAALAEPVSASSPGLAEQHFVPPRPDLMQQLQMSEGGNERLLAASADDVEPDVAFQQYLAQKLGGHYQGAGYSAGAQSGVGLKAAPPASRLLAVLIEFGEGPQHNQIPQPPASPLPYDYWVQNFDRNHYRTMLFDVQNTWSLRNWVREASYQAFDLQGDVRDWQTIAGKSLADYGADDPAGGVDNVGPDDLAQFVRDSADKLAGWVPEGGWSQYHSGDGVLDYFFVVHAGRGQESGGGIYGDDSIWSTCGTLEEPYQFGTDPANGGASLYVRRFVVVAEDSPVGVWAHELGHLFGLPDTWNPPSAGNPNVNDVAWPLEMADAIGEASPSFYDPMAQGCWLGMPMGTRPASMAAWSRIQLGWLTPRVWNANTDEATSIYLAQLESSAAADRALKIVLPELEIVSPHTGDNMWAPMCYAEPTVPCCDAIGVTQHLTLQNIQVPTDGSTSLDWWQWYDLIEGYDLAYVMVVGNGTLLGRPELQQIPGLPHAFYGGVQINGMAAPVGTQVQVQGTGVSVGVQGNPLAVTVPGHYGGPGAFDPKLLAQGSIADGETLTFYINGSQAQVREPDDPTWDNTFPWSAGAITHLDLRLGEGWATGVYTVPFGSSLQVPGNDDGWVPASIDLTAYAGNTIDVVFVLERNVPPGGLGWFLDTFALVNNGAVIGKDDLDPSPVWSWAPDDCWQLYGPIVSEHYYLAEWRNDKAGFDVGLQEAYNWLDVATGRVEYFRMNPGLLIWYVNPIYRPGDNNVLWHPGEGFMLAIDAHATPEVQPATGKVWRTRVQMQDATFRAPGKLTYENTLTYLDNGTEYQQTIGGKQPKTYFWDKWSSYPYWDEDAPYNSAKTLQYGVRINVRRENEDQTGATLDIGIDAADMSESTKSVNRQTAHPGQVLRYTIALVNNGIADAHQIVLSDTAPLHTQIVPGSLSVVGSPNTVEQWATSEAVYWSGTVPLAAPVTVTFDVTLDPVIPNGTVILNQGRIYESNTLEKVVTAETVIESAPNLKRSEKYADPEYTLAGDIITYTIILENNGDAEAENVSIKDCIPENTTFWSASDHAIYEADHPGCPNGAITWSGWVLVGYPQVITFQVQIDPNKPLCTDIWNFVEIDDGVHTPFTRGAHTSVERGPNFWTSVKTVETGGDPSTVYPGERITYTITVENVGNEEAVAQLTDVIPANTQLVGSVQCSVGACGYDAGVVSWSSGVPIAAGSSAEISFAVEVDIPLADGTEIVNTAVITATNADYVPPKTQTFTREVSTTVISAPRLTHSTKSVDTGIASYGGVMTYTITLYNDGTEDATVTLTDALPDGTEYVPGSLAVHPVGKPAPGHSNGVVNWIGEVARGETVTVSYSVSITLVGSGVIINCATVDDGVSDPFEICSSEVYIAGLTVLTDDAVYACGDMVSVPVVVSNVVDLYAFQINIDFFTSTLKVESISQGSWFAPAAWTVKQFDNLQGRVLVGATLIAQPTGKSGSGTLFWINFRVIGDSPSPSPIDIVLTSSDSPPTKLVNSAFGLIPYSAMDGALSLEGRSIYGYVDLQGRTDNSGATVYYDGQMTTTDATGFYSFCPPVGSGDLVNVRIEMPGYLWAEKSWPVPTGGGSIPLPTVVLKGGNPVGPSVTVERPDSCTAHPVTDMPIAGPPDHVINILDLTFVGARFGMVEDAAGWNPINWFDPDECYYKKDLDGRADINGDGKVDIFDLVLVGYNFNATAPVPWF